MSDTVHVLSALKLTDAERDMLQSISPRLVIVDEDLRGSKAIEEAITPETEVLLGGYFGSFDLHHAPRLRWIQGASSGVNHLHGTPLWESDVMLTSANGVHAIQIGEYSITMILAHFHHLRTLFRAQDNADWIKGSENLVRPRELRDMTIGIVGYGAIGRETARLASAFGMRVLATKRPTSSAHYDGWMPEGTGDPDGTIPERYYSMQELPELLAQSDAVVLTLPLTEATRHVIGKAELAVMQPHALLVNIGRGPLIDQDALIEVLQNKQIGGAALDVTTPEPLPSDSPLWKLDNIIITPHISGLTNKERRILDLFAVNLRRYIEGQPLINLVNRAEGY
jgi:phosphoglycerate dehydrogenase-like enzyme